MPKFCRSSKILYKFDRPRKAQMLANKYFNLLGTSQLSGLAILQKQYDRAQELISTHFICYLVGETYGTSGQCFSFSLIDVGNVLLPA